MTGPVCARKSCPELVSRPGEHCSQLCRRVTLGLASCPPAVGPMTLGYGAAVAQAGPLKWLDTRIGVS